jgi:hypothetical protein
VAVLLLHPGRCAVRGWRKPSKRQREESRERLAAYMERLDKIRGEQVRKPAETDKSGREEVWAIEEVANRRRQ